MTTTVYPQASGPAFSTEKLVGFAALALTVLVWSGFFLSLRAGARAALPPIEIALFRFGPASLCFLPVLITRWRKIVAVPAWQLAAIVVGAGLPYFLVAGMGMRHAPVADGATLLPGTLPLSVSALAALLLGQRISAGRRNALGLIAGGVLLMVLLSILRAQPGLWQGYALFFLGSGMWACFTLALRQSGLSPVEGAAVVTWGSLPLLVAALAASGQPLHLGGLSSHQIGFYLLAQGVGVGLISTLSFAYAVSKIGAERSAIAGALTPVVASLLAIPMLHEWPPLTSLVGMVLIVAGVMFANRQS